MPHRAIWVKTDASQEIRTIEGNYDPPQGDLLLKTVCVGVNPGDYKHPIDFGAVDTIEGFDVVGIVEKVGPQTAGFSPGDKVVTFARGIGPPEWGGSQEYFLALAKTCWKYDEIALTEEQAATIPLTACTAGDGLYNKLKPPLPLPWEVNSSCEWPILLWGASAQIGIQAIQYAKLSGCSPIIVTASPKQHDYLRSLGADFAFDYRAEDVVRQIKAAVPAGKHLRHAFDCVGTDISPLEDSVEPGGSIALAIPPVRASLNHHAEMAIAGTIHDLDSFRAADFKFHNGVEPHDSDGAVRLQKLMAWTFEQVGKAYRPPKVRRLGGKGMYDAFECFELMRQNKISGEKCVWRMSETPELQGPIAAGNQ